MNANKRTWINLGFDVVESVTKQMRGLGEIKAHIVTLSFNRIHIFGPDKQYSLAILDRESFQIPWSCFKLLQHRHDAFRVGLVCSLHKSLRVIDSLSESFTVERLS